MSQILSSYIFDRKISVGIPQGSVLGPIFYVLYTNNIPQSDGVVTAIFADETSLLATGQVIEFPTSKLQTAANNITNRTATWCIKLNLVKLIHVNFTIKKYDYIPVVVNQQIMSIRQNIYA